MMVVQWLAKQPYCNGKVAMWGGSYAGYDQWATAKELPPHLATIIPAASAFIGLDFPMEGNVFAQYDMQWLTFTSGHTSQQALFEDTPFWAAKYRQWFTSRKPYASFDTLIGNPLAQEVKKSSRLRLILCPINSIYREKNYNSGGVVQRESLADAHPVTVTLYHDRGHPSTLQVPLAAARSANEPIAPASAFSAPAERPR